MPKRLVKVLVKPQEQSVRRLPPLRRRVQSHLVKRSEKCAMTKVGVVSDVVPCENGGPILLAYFNINTTQNVEAHSSNTDKEIRHSHVHQHIGPGEH